MMHQVLHSGSVKCMRAHSAMHKGRFTPCIWPEGRNTLWGQYCSGCNTLRKDAFLLSRIQTLYAAKGEFQQENTTEAQDEWNKIKQDLLQLEGRAQLILTQNMASNSEAVTSPEVTLASAIEVS